jgi:hypothetical protein
MSEDTAPFVMWSCGHAHQPDPDGRVLGCPGDGESWYILEAGDLTQYDGRTAGLAPEDYTLHTRSPVDRTFSPARACSDPFACRVAEQAGRRLMIWDGERYAWRQVLP